MDRPRLGAAIVLAGAVMGTAMGLPAGWASEPAEEFLEALRERRYFDVALDYLDAAANDPAVPQAFKELLLYERGVTLVQASRIERDPALREKQLDQAQQVLEQFLKEKPGSLYIVAARNQLGTVLVERARQRLQRAQKATGQEKTQLVNEAKGLFDRAQKEFGALVEELRTRLKSYPAALDAKKDAKRIEERDRFRQDFLQAQLLAAAAREESAEALDKGSKGWTDALTSAADMYKKIYEDYRTRMAGLYARMYQGRCLQKLGKHKEASAVFNELLANPDNSDAFRGLKLKLMPLAVESWMAQQLYPEILDKAVKFIESARPSEERTPEMLAVRLAVGRAAKAYADQLKAKNPSDPQVRRLLAEGRRFVSYVTRFPSEYQEAARKLLPEFAAGEAEGTPGQRPPPKTFAEARQAAKDAIDAMQTASLLVKALPGRIAATKPPEQDELKKQLAQAQEDQARHQAEALAYCKKALELADSETDLNDLNLLRYFLCFLLFNEEQYYDAIVVGDLLLRHYPDSAGARPCAKIMLASFLKLYEQAPADDREFETRQIVAVADEIVRRWPDQPEASEALSTLIPFMIRARRLDLAQDYLQKIPADSPLRGTAELKTGQGMWAEYLDRSRQLRKIAAGEEPPPEGFDAASEEAALEELKKRAKEVLQAGLDRMRAGGELSKVLLTAALSLAQIQIDTSEAAQAIALLEDERIGPLTLVRKEDPLAHEEGLPQEIYKTALRAYISALAGEANPAPLIDKARGLMDALKTHLGQTPQGQQQLVQIYVRLARDLQQQMEIADAQAKRALGVGFETFLKEVAADTSDVNILYWVAETYRGMGESFAAEGKGLSAEARNYFGRAAQTYQKILDRKQADPNYISAAMATTVQLQLAKAKKGMGDYVAAANIYESILKANPLLLPVQVEAARLYQDWGGSGPNQHENYLRAIVGARPDPAKNGANTIWGWGEIARRTTSSPQFRSQFFEARYNLAWCRYQYAKAQSDPARRKEQLQRAKSDIALTVGLYPDLGDEGRKKQFDSLLRQIQRELGEPASGLAGLSVPARVASGQADQGKRP